MSQVSLFPPNSLSWATYLGELPVETILTLVVEKFSQKFKKNMLSVQSVFGLHAYRSERSKLWILQVVIYKTKSKTERKKELKGLDLSVRIMS